MKKDQDKSRIIKILVCVCCVKSTIRRKSKRGREDERERGKKKLDKIREDRKTTTEDIDVTGQQSGRSQSPLGGVGGSGH